MALDPNDAGTYRFRGVAWERKGEYGKAIADYAKAAKIDPEIDLAYDDLAMLYATCPDAKFRDGKKAVENAKKSQRLTGGANGESCRACRGLCGKRRFCKGTGIQEEAIEMAPDFIKPDLRSGLEPTSKASPITSSR